MTAEIITIGDEILIGQIVDTNSAFIAKEFNKIGVSIRQITSVQDSREHLLESFAFAKAHSDIVIITGGLGPTNDDITKHILCEFTNDSLVENAEVLKHITHIFKTYIKRPMLPGNRSQAMVPSKAEVLTNKFGTAPGMWLEKDGTVFISLPGVPYEMKGLISNEVIPRIKERFDLPFIMHKTLLTFGMGESMIAQRLESFEANLPKDISLAYLPSLGSVRLRLSSKGVSREKVLKNIEQQVAVLQPLIEDVFVGFEEEGAYEQVIANLLVENSKTLAIAESCTGGALVQKFTQHPGASQYLKGSSVTYATESKIGVLGVQKRTIDEHSVVSEGVAIEMATRVRELYKSDIGISTTGNAGPSKGDADAPVGTVYVGIATDKGVVAHKFTMGTNRTRVIGKTVNKCLELLQEEILKN
jgi:nicotinamide-nucleotide amidase